MPDATVQEYLDANADRTTRELTCEGKAILIALLQLLNPQSLADAVAAGVGGGSAGVTPHFKTLGASASQVIPIGAKGYFATILTGTGTIGGEAVPAGVGVGSSNTLAATVTIATNSASSAFVSWET